MISKEEARAAAMKRIEEMATDSLRFVIVGDAYESDFGWTFCYDSTRHIETGETKDLIAGNCPVLIDKESGAVVLLPTFVDLRSSMTRYDELRTSGPVSTGDLSSSLRARR